MEENKIIQYVVRYIYTYFQNCQKYVKENNNCLDIEQTIFDEIVELKSHCSPPE